MGIYWLAETLLAFEEKGAKISLKVERNVLTVLNKLLHYDGLII
jgi:hypothetical protein